MPGLIEGYRQQVYEALGSLGEAEVAAAVAALVAVHHGQGSVFVLCPPEDGGEADHLARELAKGVSAGQLAFKLVRLEGSPRRATAWQNDWAYEDIYAKQLGGAVRNGDAVIALGGRGQALGMIRALQVATRSGARAIAIVGPNGGMLQNVADICLHVRAGQAEQVENVQLMLAHLLGAGLRTALGDV